jgi:hypothetical protein
MNPEDFYTLSWAISLADDNLGRGIKWEANLSTTVRIVALQSDGGSPATKSWDI